MIETLDKSNKQPLSSSLGNNGLVTFDLAPSQQRARIRSVLAARKRKYCVLLSSPSNNNLATDSLHSETNSSKKKQQQVFDDLMLNGGLPSPPVDSPKAEFPSLNHYDNPSLNAANKAPLPSNLPGNGLSVEDIQSKLAALREEKHRLFQLMKRLVEQEEQKQANRQTRKRKPSRWNSASVDSKPTHSLRSAPRSYHSHGYFGQQPVIHHPYLY